jgi:hypothetical protein
MNEANENTGFCEVKKILLFLHSTNRTALLILEEKKVFFSAT